MTTATPTSDPKIRLLEAGGPIFARDGLDVASVHEMGKLAGLTASAINYHFGGKEAFYIEAVRAAYQACLERVPLPTWPNETPVEERLHGFIHNFLTRVVLDHEPPWHAQLIMRELFQPTPACQVLVEEFVRPTFHILQGILQELLPAAATPMQRQCCAFSIVGQCLHYRLARPVIHLLTGKNQYTAEDVETLADHIARFSLRGLGGLTEERSS